MYWDGEENPSVECPVGDFFGMGWQQYKPISSLAVCVNPGSAFNCYWPMPFRKKAKFTLENIVIDNYLFGVAAIGAKGNESVVVFPSDLLRRR